ncbi:Triose-phosphate Transporter [Haplosporangium sp. Z 11]|nr:Triose-phosphate Transporter [Haplosporangium sp. Z 11]
MTESPQGSLTIPGHSLVSSTEQQAHSQAPIEALEAAVQRRGHSRTDSISSSGSHSSDDGIEWESPGYYASEYTDDSHTGYSSDEEDDRDYEEQDTRQLLATSSQARVAGMGMGMRVGETGTGTTIGLDLERENPQYDEDYDTLPLTTMDADQRQSSGDSSRGYRDFTEEDGVNGRKERRSKRRSHSDRRRSIHAAMPMGFANIQTEQERLIAKRQLRIKMLWNVFYVFAWYGCSTSLSFYNKWLFSPNLHNFRFPLFTTSLHMVAQFALSSLTLTLIPNLRPRKAPSVKDFGHIMPCAVASGLDIGLSNSSLKSITLAFYTMCKSSSLAFVLLFAFVFKLERPTWTLAGVIGVICVGLFMMVMSEVDFVLIGFIQVMLASVLGGLRWSLTQLLLERSDTKTGSLANPISTIFFLSPVMGICLFIVTGVFEGYGNIFSSEFFMSVGSTFVNLGLLFLGGIFAFLMVLAEFNLIARTSVVSLSVLGIIKEVLTIVVSALVFHDQLTIVNILGLFITLTGIGFYHFMKLREMKAETRRAAKEIAELNIATASDRADSSIAQIPIQRYRRPGRSSRSHKRIDHQEQGQESMGSGISAETVRLDEVRHQVDAIETTSPEHVLGDSDDEPLMRDVATLDNTHTHTNSLQ